METCIDVSFLVVKHSVYYHVSGGGQNLYVFVCKKYGLQCLGNIAITLKETYIS